MTMPGDVKKLGDIQYCPRDIAKRDACQLRITHKAGKKGKKGKDEVSCQRPENADAYTDKKWGVTDRQYKKTLAPFLSQNGYNELCRMAEEKDKHVLIAVKTPALQAPTNAAPAMTPAPIKPTPIDTFETGMKRCSPTLSLSQWCQLHVVDGSPQKGACDQPRGVWVEGVLQNDAYAWAVGKDQYNDVLVPFAQSGQFTDICYLQIDDRYAVYAKRPIQAATRAGVSNPTITTCEAPKDLGKENLNEGKDNGYNLDEGRYLASKIYHVMDRCASPGPNRLLYFKLNSAIVTNLINDIAKDKAGGRIPANVNADKILADLEEIKPLSSTWVVAIQTGSSAVVALLGAGAGGYIMWKVMQSATDRQLAAIREQMAQSERLHKEQLVATKTEAQAQRAADQARYDDMVRANKAGTEVDAGKFLCRVNAATDPEFNRLIGCEDELAQLRENCSVKEGPKHTLITTKEDQIGGGGVSRGGGKTTLRRQFSGNVARGVYPELADFVPMELDTRALERAGAKYVGMGGAVADSLVAAVDAVEFPQGRQNGSASSTPAAASCGAPQASSSAAASAPSGAAPAVSSDTVPQGRPCLVGISELHLLLKMFTTGEDANGFLDRLLTHLEDPNRRSVWMFDTNQAQQVEGNPAFLRRVALLWHRIATVLDADKILRIRTDAATAGTGIVVTPEAIRAMVDLSNAFGRKWNGAMPSNALALMGQVVASAQANGHTGEVQASHVAAFVADQIREPIETVQQALQKAQQARAAAMGPDGAPPSEQRVDVWGKGARATAPAVAEAPAPAVGAAPVEGGAPVVEVPAAPPGSASGTAGAPSPAAGSEPPAAGATPPAAEVAPPAAPLPPAEDFDAAPVRDDGRPATPPPEEPVVKAPARPLNGRAIGITAFTGIGAFALGYGASYAYSRTTGEEMSGYAKFATYAGANIFVAMAQARLAGMPFSFVNLVRLFPAFMGAGLIAGTGSSMALEHFAGLKQGSHGNAIASGLAGIGIVAAAAEVVGGTALANAGIIGGGVLLAKAALPLTAAFAVGAAAGHFVLDRGLGWALSKGVEALGVDPSNHDGTTSDLSAKGIKWVEKKMGIDEAMYKFWKWTGII